MSVLALSHNKSIFRSIGRTINEFRSGQERGEGISRGKIFLLIILKFRNLNDFGK